MTKITLTFAIIFATILLTKAQDIESAASETAPAPIVPLFSASPANFYQNFLLKSTINKLINVTLPADLEMKVADVLSNSEVGFDACNKIVATVPFNWQSKKCALTQFRNVILQLSAIQQEAIARNATTTAQPSIADD